MHIHKVDSSNVNSKFYYVKQRQIIAIEISHLIFNKYWTNIVFLYSVSIRKKILFLQGNKGKKGPSQLQEKKLEKFNLKYLRRWKIT